MACPLALVASVRAGSSAARHERRRPETTPLYAVIHEHLESFLAAVERRNRVVPRFVERELRACLACGPLQSGFVRVCCESCGHGRLVAFSCKGRAFCRSCMSRRMADTAAHLVDRVLPADPLRQWVLLFPHALRNRLAYDHRLFSAVLRLFICAVFGALRRRARAACGGVGRSAACGAITFVQRSGDALNLNVHFHSLVLDGVYLEGTGERPSFRPLPPPPACPPRTEAPTRRFDGKPLIRRQVGPSNRLSPTPCRPSKPEPVDRAPGAAGGSGFQRALLGFGLAALTTLRRSVSA
jgi:hypothetical protein